MRARAVGGAVVGRARAVGCAFVGRARVRCALVVCALVGGARVRCALVGRALVGAALVGVVASGCAGDAAARRVRIVGAKPPASCRVVESRLQGRGDGVDAAFRELRRRAARAGATHVVVTDGPRADASGAGGRVVDAIGYACPDGAE